MPYNKDIDARVSDLLAPWETTKKKMFGGTCHLIKGNMMCGVYKDFLILRLGEKQAQKALKEPQVKPFDITGKPMKGWVMVQEDGFKGKKLKSWLEQAHTFAAALPPR